MHVRASDVMRSAQCTRARGAVSWSRTAPLIRAHSASEWPSYVKEFTPRRRRNIGRAVAGGADVVVPALSVSSGGMEWPAARGGNKGQREGLRLSLAHG